MIKSNHTARVEQSDFCIVALNASYIPKMYFDTKIGGKYRDFLMPKDGWRYSFHAEMLKFNEEKDGPKFLISRDWLEDEGSTLVDNLEKKYSIN